MTDTTKPILTTSQVIQDVPQVYSVGNHYLSFPDIQGDTGFVKSLNVICQNAKGLIEVRGQDNLLKWTIKVPHRTSFQPLVPKRIIAQREQDYIPRFEMEFNEFQVIVRLIPDLREKGLAIEFTSNKTVQAEIELHADEFSILRFQRHPERGTKVIGRDAWLGNPFVAISGHSASLALALGAEQEGNANAWQLPEREFSANQPMTISVTLNLSRGEPQACFLAANADSDGASTTLLHLRRKGVAAIWKEWELWFSAHRLSAATSQSDGRQIEQLYHTNAYFNYFFSVGRDFYTDDWTATTSRSPRYYVSGAFRERDSFCWSLPAIQQLDKVLHRQIAYETILTHYRNAGDHAHYIDGTVLSPGFELDEAASYLLHLAFDLEFFDREILRALRHVVERIEQQFNQKLGLYKTFLLPSNNPALYPYVLFDNVLVRRGYQNLVDLYERLGIDASFLKGRIQTITENLYRFIHSTMGKPVYCYAINEDEEPQLYNDPSGNLGLLYYYGVPLDETFHHTIDYYYSASYRYYCAGASYPELASDHHPTAPSGPGMCGSLLNPLRKNMALAIALQCPFDNGILSESFDWYSGEARTGMGFAAGAGYLAYALCQGGWLMKSQRVYERPIAR